MLKDPQNDLHANPHPSPNFGARKDGARPDLVVLHYTAMENAQVALDRLCDPEFEVSAHWLLGRDGRVWQLVDEEARAWHAGAGSWGAVTDINSRSIGIEIDNDGRAPFAEPAMAALDRLLADIRHRWTISPERVIGHQDMAPDRKLDPGPRFDWRRLARAGHAVWPIPRKGGPDLHQALVRFGYPPNVTPLARLTAFRHRFRPWATGPADATDLALARDLAWRFPIDPPDAGA